VLAFVGSLVDDKAHTLREPLSSSAASALVVLKVHLVIVVVLMLVMVTWSR
jgi:hypothetical protein